MFVSNSWYVAGCSREVNNEYLGDGWNNSTFRAPSSYINSVGFAVANTGKKDSRRPRGDVKFTLTIHQVIPPETPRSTHFFKIVHSEHILPKLPLLINHVNEEDIWTCDEQQRMEDIDFSIPIAYHSDGSRAGRDAADSQSPARKRSW